MNDQTPELCECGRTVEEHGNGAQGHPFYTIPDDLDARVAPDTDLIERLR